MTSEIKDVQEEIGKRLAIIEATNWPKNADYGEAEHTSSSEETER